MARWRLPPLLLHGRHALAHQQGSARRARRTAAAADVAVVSGSIQKHELITRRHEGRRSAVLPEAVDHGAVLAHAAHEAHEIAVARGDANAVHPVPVQALHHVHDERGIARVLAVGVVELLHRPYAQRMQPLLPREQEVGGPVAIRLNQRGPAALVHQPHELLGVLAAHVLGVDVDGQARAVALKVVGEMRRRNAGMLHVPSLSVGDATASLCEGGGGPNGLAYRDDYSGPASLAAPHPGHQKTVGADGDSRNAQAVQLSRMSIRLQDANPGRTFDVRRGEYRGGCGQIRARLRQRVRLWQNGEVGGCIGGPKGKKSHSLPE